MACHLVHTNKNCGELSREHCNNSFAIGAWVCARAYGFVWNSSWLIFDRLLPISGALLSNFLLFPYDAMTRAIPRIIVSVFFC